MKTTDNGSLTSPHYKRVRKFMELAKQSTPDQPKLPEADVRLLRAKLIYEEAMETIEALGVQVTFDLEEDASPRFTCQGSASLVDVIDGCCDIMVVTTGTLVACGVPDAPYQEEVDRNNLAKFGPGHYWREDGKLIKPPGHKPPDLEGVMRRLEQSGTLARRQAVHGTSPNSPLTYKYTPEGIEFHNPVQLRDMILVTDKDHGAYGMLMIKRTDKTGTVEYWQVTRKATELDKQRIYEAAKNYEAGVRSDMAVTL